VFYPFLLIFFRGILLLMMRCIVVPADACPQKPSHSVLSLSLITLSSPPLALLISLLPLPFPSPAVAVASHAEGAAIALFRDATLYCLFESCWCRCLGHPTIVENPWEMTLHTCLGWASDLPALPGIHCYVSELVCCLVEPLVVRYPYH